MTRGTVAFGVATSRDGAVTLLQLASPARRNALTDDTLEELASQFRSADADPGVRCLVVAGDEKVFASGADVRALLERSPMEIYGGDRALWWDAIRAVHTPVVSAVSGYCLGGGLELALSADVVVASESARFGLPETQLGLIPGAGGTQLLPRLVGRAVTMDMVLTGRLLDAHEAAGYGLVSRVVGRGQWLSEALGAAHAIAARPAVAQRLVKEAVRAADDTPMSAGMSIERKAFAMAFASADAREGLGAFIDKRDPEWSHA